jgi:hypothetical protein
MHVPQGACLTGFAALRRHSIKIGSWLALRDSQQPEHGSRPTGFQTDSGRSGLALAHLEVVGPARRQGEHKHLPARDRVVALRGLINRQVEGVALAGIAPPESGRAGAVQARPPAAALRWPRRSLTDSVSAFIGSRISTISSGGRSSSTRSTTLASLLASACAVATWPDAAKSRVRL